MFYYTNATLVLCVYCCCTVTRRFRLISGGWRVFFVRSGDVAVKLKCLSPEVGEYGHHNSHTFYCVPLPSRCFTSLLSLSVESRCPRTSFHHQGHRILPSELCLPSSNWRLLVSRRSGTRFNAAPLAEGSPAVIQGPGVVSSRSSGSKLTQQTSSGLTTAQRAANSRRDPRNLSTHRRSEGSLSSSACCLL